MCVAGEHSIVIVIPIVVVVVIIDVIALLAAATACVAAPTTAAVAGATVGICPVVAAVERESELAASRTGQGQGRPGAGNRRCAPSVCRRRVLVV